MYVLSGPRAISVKTWYFPSMSPPKGCPNPELIQGCAFERLDGGLQGAGDHAQRVTWSPFSWCLASSGVGVGPVRGESPSCSESGWQKAVS